MSSPDKCRDSLHSVTRSSLNYVFRYSELRFDINISNNEVEGLLVMKPIPSQFVLSIESILRYPTITVLGKGRMICMHYKNEILYAF